ncbi:MAG: outer membrane beta-barrel protein [Bryobacteraceae bacterium]
MRSVKAAGNFILVFTAAAGVAVSGQTAVEPLTDRERVLLEKIAKLEERISALEAKVNSPAVPPAAPVSSGGASEWLKDTTINFYFDGYYLWNTNRPLGRINRLRAYDVKANNFSISQTGTVIEKTPNVEAGRRWGYRLDLMYGQATETLQGSPVNEPRPQVYRPLFQAFGTYIVPIGKGLNVDFGKWASALGYENNYTKDQINYSRSYFFNFLPFYHTGFRTNYSVNDRLSAGYWLVNGVNQTEDFNGFKSQLVQLTVRPAPNSYWTTNYYVGREQRDLALSETSVQPTPRGRLHIIDTYAEVNATEKLKLAGEFDYAINRVEASSPPQRVIGGAAYLKYQFTPKFYFGQRYVRLNDLAGLFSGTAQNLNDVTSTFAFRPADGFETRIEYRRDFSNVPFFPTPEPGRLKNAQNTFTFGLLWWFGGKQGNW